MIKTTLNSQGNNSRTRGIDIVLTNLFETDSFTGSVIVFESENFKAFNSAERFEICGKFHHCRFLQRLDHITM